jgi:NAD(P) transhydrogenase subunit alpha
VRLTIGIPKESFPGERRVAIAPRHCDVFAKFGVDVVVEQSAGVEAGFSDEQYAGRGARVTSRADVFKSASVIVQVRCLGANPEEGRADLPLMRRGQTLIGFGEPLTAMKEDADLAAAGVSFFAMELIPRITRAQSMDALSSMATIAGYKAVLLAADTLPRLFPMLTTAAGTIPPARVLVIGAGVAGLQAIATARRLGAVVSAYDVRAAVKEQIESLGATFVNITLEGVRAEGEGGYARALDDDAIRRQRDQMAAVLKEQDVVITTAAVPGKKAPVLISREMVHALTPGSVIVDLAAERGGNCEITEPGQAVVDRGVTVLGPVNVPSTIPHDASQMYGRNIATFLKNMVKDGELQIDMNDEITRESMVIRDGEIVHAKVLALLGVNA